jgi:hypothetical protein
MDNESIRKLSQFANDTLIVDKYISAKVAPSEKGVKQAIIQGLVLKSTDSYLNVVDTIYCDSATITFKKD